MNNNEAKEILSAYRPGGGDAADPIFREALEQARRDPELDAWFKAEREHDAAFARAIQSLPVPRDGKQSLLALARVEPRHKRSFRPTWSVAIAAGILLALGLAFFSIPLSQHEYESVLQQEEIGVAGLHTLANAMEPLDFYGESILELRGWLAGRGAPAPASLPAQFATLNSIGCRVFSSETGPTFSLLCLEKDGELVHLFVTEEATGAALAIADRTWLTHDDWNAYCWSDNEHTYVLMSRAPREQLETLVI